MSDAEIALGLLKRLVEDSGYTNWTMGFNDLHPEVTFDLSIDASPDEVALLDRLGETFWERHERHAGE